MNETLECFKHEAAKLMQSFPYENRCESYRKFAPKS